MKTKKRLQDFEEWRQAEQRLVDLQLEYAQADSDYQLGLDSLAASRAMREAERLELEAAAILDDVKLPPTVEEVKLQNLDRRRRVLRRAIEIHKKRMHEMRMELSRTIARQLLPEYSALIKDMSRAVATLARLVDREREFRETLKDGDVSFVGVIPPCTMTWFGGLKDSYSRANLFINQAIESGYLKSAEREVLWS